MSDAAGRSDPGSDRPVIKSVDQSAPSVQRVLRAEWGTSEKAPMHVHTVTTH